MADEQLFSFASDGDIQRAVKPLPLKCVRHQLDARAAIEGFRTCECPILEELVSDLVTPADLETVALSGACSDAIHNRVI